MVAAWEEKCGMGISCHDRVCQARCAKLAGALALAGAAPCRQRLHSRIRGTMHILNAEYTQRYLHGLSICSPA